MPIFRATEGDDFVVEQQSSKYNADPAIPALKVDGKTGSVTVNGVVVDVGVVIDQVARDAATAASAAAAAAQTTANTAETDAQAAITNAATAQTTANTAVTNAAAAQTTANGAVSVNTTQTANISANTSAISKIAAIPGPDWLVAGYDGTNFDGSNNSTLTDGQGLSTIKNLGTRASTDLAQATSGLQPIFRATGGPGGTGCAEGDGSRYITVNFGTTLNMKFTTALVFQPTDLASTYVYASGASSNSEQYTDNAGALHLAAGADTSIAGVTVVAGKWHVLIIEWNSSSSIPLYDGGIGALVNPSNGGITGVTLFAEGGAFGFKAKAKIAFYGLWQGLTPSVTAIADYLQAKYGAFSQ